MARVLKLNDSVSWVGVINKDIVTFDIVMETQSGTTYNSYFIDAGKKAVIETVKETFWDEYIEKLKSITDPADIEVIVLNHTEPDHSGCVGKLLQLAPKAKIYGSRQAINYLSEIINVPFQSVVVKDNDTLSLGNKTLRFIAAPNLHWPDTMYTYLEEDQLLFTCDSFGAHFSDERIFDDLVSDYNKEFDYYFDVILKPFSKFMLKAIEKIAPLEIKAVCPGHGPILRSTWKEKVERSRKASEIYLADSICKGKKILITYVSAYGYTKQIAHEIADILGKKIGGEVTVADIEKMPLGKLEELIIKSNVILVGTPTLNQNTVLPVYKVFSVLNPIRDRGKKAAVFGSYGWSGEAVKIVENQLRQLKLSVITEGFSAKFSPGGEKSLALTQFAERLAAEILKDDEVASEGN